MLRASASVTTGMKLSLAAWLVKPRGRSRSTAVVADFQSAMSASCARWQVATALSILWNCLRVALVLGRMIDSLVPSRSWLHPTLNWNNNRSSIQVMPAWSRGVAATLRLSRKA